MPLNHYGYDSITPANAAAGGTTLANYTKNVYFGPNAPIDFVARYFTPHHTASQTIYNNPFNPLSLEVAELRARSIRWVVPVANPGDTAVGGTFVDGSNFGHALCNSISAAVNASIGMYMPTFLDDDNFIRYRSLIVYLNVETFATLSAGFWNGYALALRNHGHPSQGSPDRPFYPAIYCNPLGGQGNLCQILSQEEYCYGIWTIQNNICSYCGRNDQPYTQGTSFPAWSRDWNLGARGCNESNNPYVRDLRVRLWQYVIDYTCQPNIVCDPINARTNPAWPNIDLDQSRGEQDETYNMLWVPPAFGDLSTAHPYYFGASKLASDNVVVGYGNGNFGPDDIANRAQMAALICRAVGWASENHSSSSCDVDGQRCSFVWRDFTDQCNSSGCVDAATWLNVQTLSWYRVSMGYGDGRFGTFDPCLQAQVISFLTRAWVRKGYWQYQPDNATIYPNVPASTGHRVDICTFVYHTGVIPGTSSQYANWNTWNQGATRGWFSQVEWKAYQDMSL